MPCGLRHLEAPSTQPFTTDARAVVPWRVRLRVLSHMETMHEARKPPAKPVK